MKHIITTGGGAGSYSTPAAVQRQRGAQSQITDYMQDLKRLSELEDRLAEMSRRMGCEPPPQPAPAPIANAGLEHPTPDHFIGQLGAANSQFSNILTRMHNTLSAIEEHF